MRRRNKNVSVRMTEDEYAAFMMRVAESGQTQQSFIINAVLGAKVSGREEVKELKKLSGQFADTNRQLRGMATNINQMAHVANGYGQIPQQAQLGDLYQELQGFRKECDATWRLIRQSISLQRSTGCCWRSSPRRFVHRKIPSASRRGSSVGRHWISGNKTEKYQS